MLLILGILSFGEVAAQQNPHELSLSYGFIPSRLVGASVAKVLTFNDASLKAVGPIGIKYTYNLNNRFNAGLNLSYTKITSRETNDQQGGDIELRSSFYTFMPEFNLYLSKRGRVEIYSGLAAGISLLNQKSDYKYADPVEGEVCFAYQITALALRGTSVTAPFAELGYGYKGVLNVGVSRRF